MRWSLPRAIGRLASILLFVAEASDASLRPGDLLVTDESNARVLRVVPKTGHVETLSPKPGQQSFLQRPTGIAVSRFDRSIYVIDDEDGQLVRIDPATGDQVVQRTRVLDNSTGVPLLIPVPLVFPGTVRGLEIPPKDPQDSGDRVLVIGDAGVYETRRTGNFWTTPALRASPEFPSVAGAALDRYGDPLRLWVATGGTTLQEATAFGAGIALEQAALFPGQQIVDVDVSPSGRSAMLVRTSGPVPGECASAVVFSLSFQALSSGQQLRCPTALALGPRGELYIADVLTRDGGLARIVRVVDGEETIVADLPAPIGTGQLVDPVLPADVEVMPGEASFEWIATGPTDREPVDASANGDVVVGLDTADPEASWWRWTRAGGLETIGPGAASGVSASGSVVVGLLPSNESFLWSPVSGTTLVTPLPGPGYSEALGISADGEVLVGFVAAPGGDASAVRWRAGGPVALANLADTDRCYGVAASRDGAFVAGTCEGPGPRRVVRWGDDGEPLDLGELGDGFLVAWISDVSGDGQTVLVTGFQPGDGGYAAFRWTAAEGLARLHPPSAGYQSWAGPLSRDGRRALIHRVAPAALAGRSLWDPVLGTRDLWTELVEVYGLDVARADADSANVLSDDGRTLLGRRAGSLHVWRIRLVPEPGGGALALAALGALAWLARRRRVSARPRAVHAAAAGLLTALLTASAADAAPPRPGDLLITDENNARVLRVVPKTGHVEVLSPKPDQQSFLQRPTGIAVSRASRSIYVLDAADGQLIRIDPATGQQFVQRTRVFDPDIGAFVPVPLFFPGTLRGLEIPPREPGAVGDRVLVIGSAGVHETSSNGSTWSAPVLRTTAGFPSPAGTALDRYGDPLRLWVATGGTTLQEATASGAGFALEQAALFPGQQIADVDVSPSGRSAMLVRSMSAPKVCISAVVFSLTFQALSSGQELRCPTALALGPRGELYIADVLTLDGGLAKIVKVVDGVETVVAELPLGDSVLTLPADIEVMPGEASFEWVEHEASDIRIGDASADGEVVVGEEGSEIGDATWWRWTRASGRETMGAGEAYRTSSDGGVVVGFTPLAGGGGSPWIWRASTGFAAPLPAIPGATYAIPESVSGDGSTFIGYARFGDADDRAVRWRNGLAAVLERPAELESGGCTVDAVSHDGTIAGGNCDGLAVRWDAAGVGTSLGDQPMVDVYSVRDLSADGQTVLLSSSRSLLQWNASDGYRFLTEPGVDYRPGLASMSRDGRRVFFVRTEPLGLRGRLLWDSGLGLRDLWTELVEVYGLDVARALPDGAHILSRDGRALIGYEGTPSSRAIWRIRLVPEPGGGALALAALGALGWLARRRRVSDRSRAARPAAAGLLAALLTAGAADAAPPRPGDLLVTDENNGRVLRVVPSTGHVEVLSPKPGQTNHLQRPTGIAVSRHTRSIYVLDAEDGELVRIDPSTGAQLVQRRRVGLGFQPLHFPGAIRGLEIPPVEPAAVGDEVVVIGSLGVHRSFQQRAGDWSVPELLTGPGFPAAPAGSALDRYGDPLRVWIATGGTTLQEVTASGDGLVVTQAASVPGQQIVDVDVSPTGRSAMLVSIPLEPSGCESLVYWPGMPDVALPSLRCPAALAHGPRGELYVADAGSPLPIQQRSARVARLVGGEATIVAMIPPVDRLPVIPADIAVMPGEATFEWIEPEPVHVESLRASVDGGIVIGSEYVDGQPATWWRWTPDAGREPIGLGRPIGLSADGSIAVGVVGSGSSAEYVTWTEESGFVPIAPVPGADSFRVSGISGDGSTLVGVALTPSGGHHGVRWRAGVPQLLSSPPGLDACAASSTSRDGSVVVGQCSGFATRWDERGAFFLLNNAPLHLGGSMAVDVSDDGNRVLVLGLPVGVDKLLALLWTPAGGIQFLMSPEGLQHFLPISLSGNGRTALLRRSLSPPTAFLWDADLEVRDLWEELSEVYGLDIQPEWVGHASFLSRDGRTLLGNPHEAGIWRIRLVPEPGGGALALAALGALGWLARRRRVSARPRATRAAAGGLLAALLAAGAADAAPPRPGDLLVTDENNARVLRVVPKTGHVETLSPKPDQQSFLQRPTGIAVSRFDRAIYVLDSADGQLIRIDAATGEQVVQRTRVLDNSTGVPLLIPVPLVFPGTVRGLEIPPKDPQDSGDRVLVIGDAGVYETRRTGNFWTTPALRASPAFPSVAGAALDRYGDPLRLWVATGGTTLQEATASGAGFALEQVALFPGQQIVDVDVSASGRSAMLVRSLSAPKVCISAVVFSLTFQALSSGQELRCPTALALGPRGELYIADVLTLDGGLAKIVRVVDGVETLVAELPPGGSVLTLPADVEVMPGEASFESLTSQPGFVSVRGVSGPGDVVVGTESGSWWRWTASEGLQTVDTGSALGVSLDGSIVWGYAPDDEEYFTWRAASGSSPVLPPQGFDFFGVTAMSGDGSTLVGSAGVGSGSRAVRWQAGSPVVLPDLQDTTDCFGSALSRNGSVAVGACVGPAGRQATSWDASGTASSLHGVPLDPFPAADATDVSHDGSIVAGTAFLGGRDVVFRWTAAGGIQRLQPSAGADYPTQLLSLSGDGHKVLIATNETLGFVFDGRFLWDPDFGYRDLWTELAEVYGMDLEPAVVNQAVLMSKDARTLVGYHGALPNREIWRIRLVPEPHGAALAMAALVPLAWLGLRRRT